MIGREIVVVPILGCPDCEGARSRKVPVNADQIRCLKCGGLWKLTVDRAAKPILVRDREGKGSVGMGRDGK